MSNQDDRCAIAVIGGGAAGLATAIFAAETAESSRRCTIVVLDGARSIGAKILVSGGGRCNVTHDVVEATDFFGNRRIIKNVLAAFSVDDTIGWFDSMGVELKREETGKLFPVTNKARTVLNALLDRCRALDVDIRTDHRVVNVERVIGSGPHFLVTHRHGTLRAEKVVLATGGRSLRKSGSDGFGYELARSLGHDVTPTVPALVPLLLDDRMFHKTLSGLSQDVELTTTVGGKVVDRRIGSLLWTHFGISGPVVMDTSRFWTLALVRGGTVELSANFLPGSTPEQVKTWLMEEAALHPRRSVVHTVALRLPDRCAQALCLQVQCDPRQAIGQVRRTDRDRLVAALARFPLRVMRDRGWNYAEVTAGGVPLEEISFRTMESRLAPALYLVGEILDCDGRIGGFNFQWAWATGKIAGRALAR